MGPLVRQVFQYSFPLLHVDRLEMLSLHRAFLPRTSAHTFYKSPPRPMVPRSQLTVCLDARLFVLSVVLSVSACICRFQLPAMHFTSAAAAAAAQNCSQRNESLSVQESVRCTCIPLDHVVPIPYRVYILWFRRPVAPNSTTLIRLKRPKRNINFQRTCSRSGTTRRICRLFPLNLPSLIGASTRTIILRLDAL